MRFDESLAVAVLLGDDGDVDVVDDVGVAETEILAGGRDEERSLGRLLAVGMLMQ